MIYHNKAWQKETGAFLESNARSPDSFGTQDHSSMQHPTQNNTSPVEGDHTTPWKGHGTPEEHKVYAEENQKKADWHLQRWGNPKQPQATLAKAMLHQFRANVAKNWK